MKILLLNQAFYPDVVSSGQHATDLAVELAERGCEVTVISSRRAYDDPSKLFAKSEVHQGIRIERVRSTGFGKKAKWRRGLDFASFLTACFFRLLTMPKFDVVLAMTSPPIISFLAALFTMLRGGRLVLWVMDLNPDEAIAAGWLKEQALVTRCLEGFLRFSLRRSERVIVMDRFMKQRLAGRGCPDEHIDVIPPWSHAHEVGFDPDGRERFRAEHGLAGKYVVMYSGNHSPCHPLDTILGAAERLASRSEIAFCFVGGGSEFQKVKRFAQEKQLRNIVCLPYQPLNKLSASLSSADLHAVVLGDPFLGMVHPCKIYNILTLGIPVLYVGPSPSHITEMLPESAFGTWAFDAEHGDVDAVCRNILDAAACRVPVAEERAVARKFAPEVLLPRMCESLGAPQSQDLGFAVTLATPTIINQEDAVK